MLIQDRIPSPCPTLSVYVQIFADDAMAGTDHTSYADWCSNFEQIKSQVSTTNESSRVATIDFCWCTT